MSDVVTEGVSCVPVGTSRISTENIPPLDDKYRALDYDPRYLADFSTNFYVVGRQEASSSTAFTHARSSNATMVDSDGLLKWAPHNLLRYSEELDNAAWFIRGTTITTIDAIPPPGNLTGSETIKLEQVSIAGVADYYQAVSTNFGFDVPYSFGVWVKRISTVGTLRIINPYSSLKGQLLFDMSLLPDEWEFIYPEHPNATLIKEFTTDTTGSGNCGLMFTKNTGSSDIDFYVCAPHIYRSDLGGMVDNPDRGDSYVPTTSSALYLPRIGHHVYNGSAWVNEGYLHESEARTNLVLSSGDLSGFSGVRSSLTSDQAVSPTGNVDATAFIEDSTAANTHVGNLLVANPAAAGTYTFSVYAKQNGRQYFYVHLNVDPASTNITYGAVFDLDAGTVAASGSQGTPTSTDHSIQDVGNGWYRCSVTLGNPSGLRLDVRISLQDSSTFVVGGAAYNGDGVSGVYVYGAQIEAASTPSSYIPTSGSTVTRSADTMTASNLPWPAPNVIGPELVTNGTFDTDVSGWSIDGTNTGDDVSFSFSSGQMLVSRGADSVGGRPYQQIAVEIGKTYHLTFDSSYLTGGASVFYVGSTLAGNQYVSAIISSSTAEKRSFTFTAATSTMYITTWPAVNSSFTVDNISVREINPLAVSIKMDGRMTYADEGASIQSVFTRWTIDANNRIETRLDTNSTLTGQVTFLQTASGTTDLVNSSTTAYSPGILVPYTIASRHGSTFLNGAIDGTALTADTTPTALPDLSATDLNLGYDYMGTIKEFAIWNVDLTDAGLEEATE